LYGGFISAGSSTVSNTLQVAGPLSASSTLSVAGLASQYGGFISSASSTVAGPFKISGNLQASSSVSLATTTITVNVASTSPGIPLTLYNTQSGTNTQNRLAFQILAIATTSPGEVTEATTTAAITSILTQNYNPASGNLIFFTLNSGLLREAGRFTNTGGLIAVGSSTISNSLNVTGPLSASSTLSVAGLASQYGGFISAGSSTISNTLQIAGAVFASSTLSADRLVIGSGTSTFVGNLRASYLDLSGTAATSTFSNGIRLSGGSLQLILTG
jgi:hypothetical protein